MSSTSWPTGPAAELVPGRFSRAAIRPMLLSRNEEEALESSLGLASHGPRASLRAAAIEEFQHDADGEDKVAQDRFLHTAGLRWFRGLEQARAAFAAADRDDSGSLSAHQYLLLRESFVHTDAPHHPATAHLQCAAIFHFFDRDHSGTLTPAQLLQFVRELCTGSAHVENVAGYLFQTWPCSMQLDDFVGQFVASSAGGEHPLHRGALSLQAFLQGFRRGSAGEPRRVVFDGRSEVATTSADASPGCAHSIETCELSGFAVNPEVCA